MKKLIALYKCYRGGEWFSASLESIRPHCDGVVAVMASEPWLGSGIGVSLPENCQQPLAQFTAKYPEFPVIQYGLRYRTNSEDQYRVGLSIIRAEFGKDCGVLLIDTDEIWESNHLRELRSVMASDHHATYFRCRIYTYLRSPFYRVYPQEDAKVVVGLANPDVSTGTSRCSNLPRLAAPHQMRDIAGAIHHMGYVRLDPEEFISKLANTSSQDKAASRPNWKQEIWDRLPKGRDLHPVKGFEGCWPSVEEIGLDVLPPEVTSAEMFWACAAHHKGGIPTHALLDNAPTWRTHAEVDQVGIVTTVRSDFAIPLCALLSGKLTQEQCISLTPRLRMSFKEVAQLSAHVNTVPANRVILEIGSGLGGSMAIMGASSPRSVYFAVDPYIPYDEHNLALARDIEVGTADQFRETITGCDVLAILHQISSADATKLSWPPIDLILIDGNHSYEHALHDLRAWWPKLKPSGTLLLHDFSGRFLGVVRAAIEFEQETGLKFNLPQASSLAWLKKE